MELGPTYYIWLYWYVLCPLKEAGRPRSYSDVQETAQLLAGRDFPTSILQAILSKAKLPSRFLAVVNTTPYDNWLETVVLEWRTSTNQRMRSLSICESKYASALDYCQKTMAMKLMEDWY